ncbi:MAG: hypothetical protein DMG13_18325 [Acidobacteria bacterium]|nr:MAG: hypothetical protein DMG13_18325 [Acidobacteriota bacterium]
MSASNRRATVGAVYDRTFFVSSSTFPDPEERRAVVDRAYSSARRQMNVNRVEANYWWRKNQPVGALLNSLMFLFVIVPPSLVLKGFFALSFVVFAFMVPYGLFVRYLAVRAVRHHLANHPEVREEFENDGIIF